MIRIAHLALLAALTPALACTAAAPTAESGARAPAGPATAERERQVPVSYLPHPAFAQGKHSGAATTTTADVAEAALPSVVNVSSTKTVQLGMRFEQDPFFRHFFGPGGVPRERQERGLGSGVIVSADGVILTNNHVIEGAKDIRVTTSDSRELDAEVVGTDPKSDLAVLRVKGKAENLVPIRFGDSSRLRLGDVVLAIGNPFGVGQTVTMGIVSAKGRANVGIVDYEDFIQTDAAINPGNSGGALVNMEGQLVGINTAILSRTGGYMGVGFAIPTNMVKPIMESLVTNGRVVRGWLGIFIQPLDKDLAVAMRLPPDTRGVVVSDIAPDGPASKGGLERGDVVTKIDGRAVSSPGELRNVVATLGAQRTVTVDVLRGGTVRSLTVPIGEMPEDGAKRPRFSSGPDGSGSLDGLLLETLGDAHRKKHGIPPRVRSGAVVVGVDPGSAAARAGLRPGDVVLEVNRTKIASVGDFEKAYAASKTRTLLLVHRDGNSIFIAVQR